MGSTPPATKTYDIHCKFIFAVIQTSFQMHFLIFVCISLSYPEIFGEDIPWKSAGLWPFIFLQSWSIPNFQGLRVLRWNPEEVVTFRWSISPLLLWWWTTAPVEGMFFFLGGSFIIPFDWVNDGEYLVEEVKQLIVQVVNPQQVVWCTLPL